jgi:hypothetical protein
MSRKSSGSQKKNIVAFKVEDDLAVFLNNLPNKSDFIRKAIMAQFGMTCPLCTGSGVVPRGVHAHFNPIIKQETKRPCEKCKQPVDIPLSVEGITGTEKQRFEQFLHGGQLYCEACYSSIPKCDDCEWHVPMEKIAEHFKTVHLNT